MPNSEPYSFSGLPQEANPAVALLMQIGVQISIDYAEELRKLKLAPLHVSVMQRLGESPGVSQGKLASMIGKKSSQIVSLLQALRERELIERRILQDGHTNVLTLTREGKAQLRNLAQFSSNQEETLFEPLSPEEKQAFLTLLQMIASGFGPTPSAVAPTK